MTNEQSAVVLVSPLTLLETRPGRSAVLGSCRSVQEFEKLNRVGEGTYGIVYRARDTATRRVVALKRVKMAGATGGMAVSSLREIALLRRSRGHRNVVELVDVVVGRELTSVFLTMEYCAQDIAALIDHLPEPFLENQVKCLMQQLIRGLEWIHSLSIVHRDLKMSNLLLTDDGVLKIADFGMARRCGDTLDVEVDTSLSPTVVTLWYRAPELLFGETRYDTGVDLWALGCIFGELLLHEPLMRGRNEQHQIELACQLLGSPTPSIWGGFGQLPLSSTYRVPDQPYNQLRERFPYQSDAAIDMLNQLFKYDPAQRLPASAARTHRYWFQSPLPTRPADMPTFPNVRSM